MNNGKKVTSAKDWWNKKRPEVVVITRNLTGHVDNSSNPELKVDILLDLTTPADAKGPVPVIMELGFVLPPSGIPRERGRGSGPGAAPAGPTWQQQALAKGWGYAVSPNSIQADNGAGLRAGIIDLVNNR